MGIAAFSLTGCDGTDDGDTHTLRDTDDPSCTPNIDASVPDTSEDGGVEQGEDGGSEVIDGGEITSPEEPSIFVSVTPLGTGCPKGTSNVSITPNGKSFDVAFASFEAIVDKNKSVDIKNCQLGIKLKSTKGLSYTVYSVLYEGYAYLEAGQSARLLSKQYFQGQPAANQREIKSDLEGPFDDSFTFQDTIGIGDAVWSPCGAERDLQINTTLRLQNANKKDGYINLKKIGGLKLGWRSCN